VLSLSQTVPEIRGKLDPKPFEYAARILLATTGVFLILPLSGIFGGQPAEIGIVEADRLNLRPEPGTTRPPIRTLKKGTRIKILERVGGWLKISHEGQTGYVLNQERYVYLLKREEDRTRNRADPNLEHLEQKVRAIGRKIDEGKKELRDYSKRESNLVDRIHDIDREIYHARTRVNAVKSEIALLEKKIKKTVHTSRALQNDIRQGDIYISKRMVALYKLSRLGRMQFLATADSLHAFFQRETNLQRILAHDDAARSVLIEKKTELQRLLAGLNGQQIKLQSLKVDLNKQINALSKDRKGRSGLLARIRSRKSLEKAWIESLIGYERDLEDKIRSLHKGSPYLRKTLFPSLKGLLRMPVKGTIANRFGRYKNITFNVVNFRSGIDIKADRGEPIRAVFSGEVLYSDWFKGYGKMIIIDHGNNYHTVYAHLEESFKLRGDMVGTEEVIATVGDTGSLIGPGLYFEVRHHGKPLDPIQWIKKG
jgi:septal ring factor EnvC (AmiA/AmiB activator)